MQGFGALVGALVIGKASAPRAYTRIYLASTAVVPARRARLRPSTSFPLSLLLNLICGVSIGGFSVLQSSILILAAARSSARG